ncbi:hypothetical protein M2163_008584 [Streptomyces sp. SAI-135]|uniref:hypothetical protein n=1 Tax=Streptomyces sp. SAI-090 TaxID=2940545 RepID=UPI0024767E3B|nr:hypothetical protein [Streptomyces sp. SAI-090]MDH6514441.1 hypothetical protein [Streptomyces sp. SAI-090]MDH6621476.1 hypothetical protein [Streptomyces sp. SAI-135]
MLLTGLLHPGILESLAEPGHGARVLRALPVEAAHVMVPPPRSTALRPSPHRETRRPERADHTPPNIVPNRAAHIATDAEPSVSAPGLRRKDSAP